MIPEGVDRFDQKYFEEQTQQRDWFISKAIYTDYTVLDKDKIKTFFCSPMNGSLTITLPTAADNLDRVIEVFDVIDSVNTITVEGEGAETINGVANFVLSTQYEGIRVKCNGTEWFILDWLQPPP